MDDLISRQAVIDAILAVTGNSSVRELYEHVQEHGLSDMWSGGVNAAIDIIIAVPSAQPDPCEDAVSREKMFETIIEYRNQLCEIVGDESALVDIVDIVKHRLIALPPAQPDIIHCRECIYGEQNDVGRWFCRSLGCQIGNEDGSGYCADAERRTDGAEQH